jgi:hypothetical protein
MKNYLIVFIIFLISSVLYAAGPTFPARIGGSVTVDGVLLTDVSGRGFVIKVTTKDGKDFIPPAEDNDGLNGAGKYIIDIPVHDQVNLPGGAKPESQAIIRVFKNGKELKVVSPPNGTITVGKGGTIAITDIVLSTDQ